MAEPLKPPNHRFAPKPRLGKVLLLAGITLLPGLAWLVGLAGLTSAAGMSGQPRLRDHLAQAARDTPTAIPGPAFFSGAWQYRLLDGERGKWGDFDSPAWLRYFGLASGDLTGDGYPDIVSGRYFYRNPGGDLAPPEAPRAWTRIDLGRNLDAILITDVDGDDRGDLIAQALPDLYWVEALDPQGDTWEARPIATAPPTDHRNSQGFALGQLVPGGRPEIVLASGAGIHYYAIPADPTIIPWPKTLVTDQAGDEGLAIADIDGDGLQDLIAARGSAVAWWRNPGDPALMDTATITIHQEPDAPAASLAGPTTDARPVPNRLPEPRPRPTIEPRAASLTPAGKTSPWQRRLIGSTAPHDADRILAADLDGDGRAEVLATQELVDPEVPEASLFRFHPPATPASPATTPAPWTRERLFTGYSLNSLGTADLDEDGDLDLVIAEHKGPSPRLLLLENQGPGTPPRPFLSREIDRGQESHLGAHLTDLDQDGDLDILSIAWVRYQNLHLWRNDRRQVTRPVVWRQVSTQTGALPRAQVGSQSSLVVADFDQDGRDDYAVGGWFQPDSLVWFRATPAGRERYLIDNRHSHIEAGGLAHDIDGDGDLDILQGGSWRSHQVWWWENPHPDHRPDQPWPRHTIKDGGHSQHHDQIIGDFIDRGPGTQKDGPHGSGHVSHAQLAFWNQGNRALYLADLPANPRDPAAWTPVKIWSYRNPPREGLAKADIDDDGQEDLIGGGYWFKHHHGQTFQPQAIDPAYGQTRVAAADLIPGGRPEILLTAGDAPGPLNLYQWKGGTWQRTTLIGRLDHGHSLQIGDLNGDGHLDIYTAEMHTPGAGAACRQRVLYGDGRGGFETQLISTGIGTHEGKLGDLDGDGDLDLIQKDFDQERRIDLWYNEG